MIDRRSLARPKTLSVVWLPEADAELQEARAWYDDIRPALAERFAGAVETAIEEIAEADDSISAVYF